MLVRLSACLMLLLALREGAHQGWCADNFFCLPPACCPQVGALVLEAFPPRGIIHFLEKQHTQVGAWVRTPATAGGCSARN